MTTAPRVVNALSATSERVVQEAMLPALALALSFTAAAAQDPTPPPDVPLPPSEAPSPLPASDPEPAAAPVTAAVVTPDAVPVWAINAYYLAGVAAGLAGGAGAYALASVVGHEGSGLGPPIVGLLIGALLPPILMVTAQWGVWQLVQPGRDRFWPAFLVALGAHLAAYIGATLGGASIHDGDDAGALVVSEAVLIPILTTATTVWTRRSVGGAAPPQEATAAPAGRVIVPLWRGAF
jgi:hypothetical protein